MYWVLQNNIFSETGWDTLVETLKRFNIPFSEHKVIPFIGQLENEPDVDHKNVICFGSYSMRHVAKARGWNPGVFDLFDQDFLKQKEHWGENMLNFDSEVVEFQHAVLKEASFIRPIDDSKYFAGHVVFPNSFKKWKNEVLQLDTSISIKPETLIQISPLKEIYAEYRFWVVKGKIVTASQYKVGDRVIYSDVVDRIFFDYVEKAIEQWQPHEAFVIDVCSTDDGIKIVEINTLNSSGFYAGDVQKLVFALEEIFNEANMLNNSKMISKEQK